MADTGKRLGRGLGSLLGILENDEIEQSNQNLQNKGSNNAHSSINMSLIDTNPGQPRKNFDQASLNELAQSIKQHGIVQPIILTKKNNRYMIVAGERRFRAAKIVGLKTIPAVVRDYTNSQIKEIALLENIQREDLNPIESARALDELMKDFNWTQEVLAERLGKSRSSIANTVRLLSLSPDVLKMVEDGKLSAGHARSLVVISDPAVQLRLAQLAVNRKVTVRDLEKAVKETQTPKTARPKPQQSLELKNILSTLERNLGTKVAINGNESKGKLIINYYSSDDLSKIYDLLM